METGATPVLLWLALLLSTLNSQLSTAFAQLVADGATNTLSNVTTNITGNVTVGTNGSFTLLVLSDDCLLTNSGFSTIGANASAKSNEVRLVSPTARWLMGASSANSLFVGSNSAANRLVVSNGASAAAQGTAFLGYISESASNNQVWVTGSNSVWSSAASIEVGFLGSGNQVVVSNGGTVLSVNAAVGVSTITSNNLALVTGAGSLWSNVFTFSVGANGSGNRLLVSEGGVVRSSGIGRIGGELLTGSGNNLALITGSGSVWSNALDLEIGRSSGINNQLVVSNGASVFVGGNVLLGMSSGPNSNSVLATDPGTSWFVLNNLYVGSHGALSRLVVSNGATVAAGNLFVSLNASSTNNRVVVDGGTLRVTNASGTAMLDVRRGTNVLNSGTIEADLLVLTNGPEGKFQFHGGTLVTRGATLTAGMVMNGGATWDVRAGVSNHSVSSIVAVGEVSSFNTLLITNGGRMITPIAPGSVYVGRFAGARTNSMVVSGTGSECIAAAFYVGAYGEGNSLVVSNGGRIVGTNGDDSVGFYGSNNLAMVTGVGSLWSNAFSVIIGYESGGNRLVVSNGGGVVGQHGKIGLVADPQNLNNEAVVTGSGSYWKSRADLLVGGGGSGSRLLVSDGATVTASNLFIGSSPLSSNSLLVANGGAVLVTNAAGTGTLDVRHGTNRLDAGLITADLLLVTNSSGEFEFNGGQLITGATTNSNGRFFVVGNGTSDATLQLRGGTHVFTSDIIISDHGSLTGNGAIVGIVAVQSGGTLSPGASIGKLTVSVSPSLQGTTIMEISKNGSARTNDQVQAAGTFFYGGSLTVSNLGPTALALGDRFQLFIAPSYFGSFSSLTLPPLNAGLDWTNKLLVDGSIEVISVTIPSFASITVSGTNVIISGSNGTPNASYAVLASTNVALPLTNWLSITTNQFGPAGEFAFTNPIVTGIPQRFFRIRIP